MLVDIAVKIRACLVPYPAIWSRMNKAKQFQESWIPDKYESRHDRPAYAIVDTVTHAE